MEEESGAPSGRWNRLKEFEFAYRRAIRLGIFALLSLFILFYQLYLRAPSGFPINQVVHVALGQSLREIADSLEKNRVIRSPGSFKFFVFFLGTDRSILAGDYLFDSRISSPRVAWRLLHGAFNLKLVSLTLPEGSTLKSMAVIFERGLPAFDSKVFSLQTKNKEGYFFPDTYFFFPNATTGAVVAELQKNFSIKLEAVRDDIKKSGKSERDILIMASILEHEAKTTDDRKLIAGILWKRLKIGMALQVDAPFVYSVGKNTYQLTTEDLKVDSPYNTYTRRGLPAGPIGNPGLDSILAALHPTESPYLYFLSDRKGNVYYATNYEGHIKNKALHIN